MNLDRTLSEVAATLPNENLPRQFRRNRFSTLAPTGEIPKGYLKSQPRLRAPWREHQNVSVLQTSGQSYRI